MRIRAKDFKGCAIIHTHEGKQTITLITTKREATPKQATRYLKGVLYDYMRPYLVEGKKQSELAKAIEEHLDNELSLIAVKEGKGARRVSFAVPNIPEAHLEEAR
jgi:hypothetical protein